MKKYELTNEIKNLPGGVVLYRIRALKDFADVKAGDLGGFVQSESNLDQDGNAWVYRDAQVYGNAKVYENAVVRSDAKVHGSAKVYGRAWIYQGAEIFESAEVFENARVCGNAKVYGAAGVYENAAVFDDAKVYGGADVCESAAVFDSAEVCGGAKVYGSAKISGNAKVRCEADYVVVKGFGRSYRITTFFRCQDRLIRVQCGCFCGTLDEFRAKVKETHRDSTMAREYLMIADLMELHFKKE